MEKSLTVGIDTGGTFTDVVVADAERVLHTTKVTTTPHDLTVCFAQAVRRSAEELGIPLDQFLRRTAVIRFSSTIATNTVLTRSGPRLGLVVTAGEERSLYGDGPDGPLLHWVPESLVVGVAEEVSGAGHIARSPDAVEVGAVVRAVLERGARILVVSLRHAATNPANELAVRGAVAQSYPRHYLGAVPMLLSTEISAVSDDALRTRTAVASAYMHKALERSLYKMEDDLRREGFPRPLLVVTAEGSVTRVAKTRALSTYQSGPAAGVHASALLCREAGVNRAVTADVGGTSTDIGVVAGGPLLSRHVDVEGMRVAQPSTEIFSLALGGGSVCRVDDGKVTVGPESMGAAPGPACYGMGGRQATPTDAWVVLGFLDPRHSLGGRRLDVSRARGVVAERIAAVLGISVEQGALAVKDAVEAMAAAGIEGVLGGEHARSLLEGAGRDGLALVAYGGAGGVLLPAVASRLGIGRLLLPRLSTVFSAFGVSTFDVRHSYEVRAAASEVDGALARLRETAEVDLRGEGFEPAAAALTSATLDDGASWLVSVSATAVIPKPGLGRIELAPSSDPAGALSGMRQVIFPAGPVDVPVYDRERLCCGHLVEGPAIAESVGFVCVVPADARLAVDAFGTCEVSFDERHGEGPPEAGLLQDGQVSAQDRATAGRATGGR
ncbi:MAG: hydantoinase/oxoprolinase family protein [Acidimicrobiales bacterium]